MTVIACDFGGTRIKVGLVRSGYVLRQLAIDARSSRPLVERLAEVAAAVQQLCESAAIRPRDCNGVGISFPSIIDPDGRVLGEFGKYGPVAAEDFTRWTESSWSLPAVIENDARLALIGEKVAGAATGHDNAVMITLGTGIGTAALVQGELLVGIHGQAAILGGHQTVVVGGRQCVCGNRGCAETEASSSALPRILAAMGRSDLSTLAPQYEDVFRAAASGDECAADVVARSLAVWGTVAVNLVHAYDPSIVVLGGGVMRSRDIILPAIAEYVTKHAHTPWGNVTVVASQLGDAAALVGAEWLVDQRLSLKA